MSRREPSRDILVYDAENAPPSSDWLDSALNVFAETATTLDDLHLQLAIDFALLPCGEEVPTVDAEEIELSSIRCSEIRDLLDMADFAINGGADMNQIYSALEVCKRIADAENDRLSTIAQKARNAGLTTRKAVRR